MFFLNGQRPSAETFSEFATFNFMNLLELKKLIRAGDLFAVTAAIDADPQLLHSYDPIDDHWNERTAMHCAALHGQLDMLRLFVDRGAEVYSNPMNTYPPIFVAKDPAVIEYFLKEIPDKADGTNGLGVTINLAARAGWTEIVSEHIDRDPLSVHQRGWIGDVPLHWSCHNGYVEIVEMLLDAGADVESDEINCYGGKPLHWASEHETEVVELLLTRGANVNSTNDLKKSDYFGITPIMMNVLMNDDCAEVTKHLLAAGADTSVTHQEKSLKDWAAEKGNTNILSVLRAHEA